MYQNKIYVEFLWLLQVFGGQHQLDLIPHLFALMLLYSNATVLYKKLNRQI